MSSESIFDEKIWAKRIRDPFWYEYVPALIETMKDTWSKDRPLYEITKERIYDFFEENLKTNTIAIGATGYNWDQDRLPIDAIVIHHTSNSPGLTKERLSAIEIVRLYAPAFAKDAALPKSEPSYARVPIYSGHFREGKQVFWPYHWMIRGNGFAERLLLDNELGWHAGNKDMNRRSIAICIDDDHEDNHPSDNILHAIASLIQKEYGNVSRERIFGHCEINTKTTCPSTCFLDSAGIGEGDMVLGWKKKLLTMLGEGMN